MGAARPAPGARLERAWLLGDASRGVQVPALEKTVEGKAEEREEEGMVREPERSRE